MEIPYHIDDEGNRVYDVPMDAANEDWIRAARLQDLADKGDAEAQKKLDELFDAPSTPASRFWKRRLGAEPDPEWNDAWGVNPLETK
jgi:hypothetical protein